ncbi:Fosfomycin resistance protein AbaF [Methylobacterium crusticola]|uniref:Fosfomycin resistance protein AbaF n=1 Tax=Methylobacterium crusticola TaxID=1697972 RepID=A0ABQ4QZI4_9HYPH|nr:MFS transporter [Methylobacterium crusticola]GJD50582.1 Fosfomycin resistance protein AbaF [Methylobacterium crusticola]
MTIQVTSPPLPAIGPAQMRRIVTSSVVGTAVEWYDFLIYGTASALVFNKLFFPSSDPAVGTIAAFATYAVGFLARPLGAAIFGHFGDKVGRKRMLAATIIIMGVGTFLIGCLPTYSQIGIWAPILLVLLRLLQGVGLGGEWGGAVLMVVENAPARRRGFFGSLVQVGNPLGNLAAVGIFTAMSGLPESEFLGWAWRVPFLISILLVGVGLFIRLRLEETPAFRVVEARKDVARLPVVEVITQHPRAFLTAVGLKLSEIAWASIASVFVISYVTGTLALPRSVVLNGIFASSFVALFSIPLFGWLSDRVGRKTMFYASCLFCIAFAFPFFWLVDTKDPTIIALAIVAAISFGQMVGFGVGAPFYSELFAARLRYSGASLGFQIGAAISGGLTPFAAASLMVWSGGATWPISIYLIAAALITIVATAMAPETARTELR